MSGVIKEHFILKASYLAVYDALPNVRRLTYCLMTEKGDAAGHCNVGTSSFLAMRKASFLCLSIPLKSGKDRHEQAPLVVLHRRVTNNIPALPPVRNSRMYRRKIAQALESVF